MEPTYMIVRRCGVFTILSSRVAGYRVHLLSSREQTRRSLSLSDPSISRQAPCGWANSACLTSGTGWSTDINNTKFSSPCMFRPFDPHHEVHLRCRDNAHTGMHVEKMTLRLGRVSSSWRLHRGISWHVRAHFFSQPLLKYLTTQPTIPWSITHLPWVHH